MTDSAKKIKRILSVGIACVIVLSTFLIFLIPLWVVMVINSCSIVAYRIIFRGLNFSVISGILIYLIGTALFIGVIVIIMYFPMNIYGETLQKILTNAAGSKYSDTFYEILYYKSAFLIPVIMFCIIDIASLIVFAVKGKLPISFFFSTLMKYMGALILLLILSTTDVSAQAWFSSYLAVVTAINYIFLLFEYDDIDIDWSIGSGGRDTDTYDIYIVKK